METKATQTSGKGDLASVPRSGGRTIPGRDWSPGAESRRQGQGRMRKCSRNEVLEEEEELQEGREERALWEAVWQTSFGNSCFLFNHHGPYIPSNNYRFFMGQVCQHALTHLSVDSQWLFVGWPLFPTKAMLPPEQLAGACLPTFFWERHFSVEKWVFLLNSNRYCRVSSLKGCC